MFAEDEREHEERDAGDRGLADPAVRPVTDALDVKTHEERDGDRRSDREHAPCALGEGADHDVTKPRERDDDDEEDRDRGDETERRTKLLARDLGE